MVRDSYVIEVSFHSALISLCLRLDFALDLISLNLKSPPKE